VINPDHIHLKRSDKVKVAVEFDLFKKMQKEHLSGWNDGMKQVCHRVKFLSLKMSTKYMLEC
jgi:hypothetical protein